MPTMTQKELEADCDQAVRDALKNPETAVPSLIAWLQSMIAQDNLRKETEHLYVYPGEVRKESGD